jgi:EAL domain-containing protein (putative c-di-GMP-specific phosphodiesterase class I)/FixJ family two-component response regulator
MSNRKLIVIDDEHDLAGFVCDVAQQRGFQTESYHHADLFRQNYQGDADVIVLDLFLPGVDGIEVIRFLAGMNCKAGLILISGFDSGVLHSAQKLTVEYGLNFIGSLNKPFRYPELVALLNTLTTTRPSRAQGNSSTNPVITQTELEQALSANQFVPFYQPKIDLATRVITGVEALVRWQHPQHGLLTPNYFLTEIENYGLMDQLTWVMLEKVVQQCQAWQNSGLDLTIAVNMSASTTRELSLPEFISGLLAAHDVAPGQIILEVTETALMQELVTSLDILTRLRMKGFNLSIDDFGTGYSSLVQLHRAPFSELKIDRSFVQEMANDTEASTIVETVIVLGHKLGMKVVAEGVETQANLEVLARMGCDLAQGYYIAQPQSGEAISDWLLQRPAQIWA